MSHSHRFKHYSHTVAWAKCINILLFSDYTVSSPRSVLASIHMCACINTNFNTT